MIRPSRGARKPNVLVGQVYMHEWRNVLTHIIESRGPIKVMALAGGYAMVRRPHACPFVLSCDKLGELVEK